MVVSDELKAKVVKRSALIKQQSELSDVFKGILGDGSGIAANPAALMGLMSKLDDAKKLLAITEQIQDLSSDVINDFMCQLAQEVKANG